MRCWRDNMYCTHTHYTLWSILCTLLCIHTLLLLLFVSFFFPFERNVSPWHCNILNFSWLLLCLYPETRMVFFALHSRKRFSFTFFSVPWKHFYLVALTATQPCQIYIRTSEHLHILWDFANNVRGVVLLVSSLNDM